MAPPTTICMNERTTRKVTAQIVDEDDAGIPAASLTTLTMTLYDKVKNTIINSRDDQDILNTNNVTVDVSGNFVWLVQADDNVIVTTGTPLEHHVALVEWTYNGGADEGRDEIEIFVRNTTRVP